jgi:hypothetical protein
MTIYTAHEINLMLERNRKQIIISFFIDISTIRFLGITNPQIKNVTFEFKNQSKLSEMPYKTVNEGGEAGLTQPADVLPQTQDEPHVSTVSDTESGGMYEGSG